jgi:hypothetical protein
MVHFGSMVGRGKGALLLLLAFSVRAFPVGASPLALLACEQLTGKKPPVDDPPPVVTSAPLPTTPPASFVATPASAFVDAGNLSDLPPVDQAREYYGSGQLWMARLVLEKQALAPSGSREEAEMLARICNDQGDEHCLADCSKKLGRPLRLDGGAPRGFDAGREHKEPETDAAKARDLALKLQYDQARVLLEPRVLADKASKADIRLLRTICDKQGDRMCVALCDAKLK